MSDHHDLHGNLDPELGDVAERLQAFGSRPVPPPVASAHLTAMATVPARRAGWSKVRVGAAFFAGLLLGGTGLASAGALPGQAQDVAHDVLGVVGLSVPRSTEGCPSGQTFDNHGDYVSSVAQGEVAGDKAEAAKSSCGKPVPASEHPGGGNGEGARSECAPPWAGQGKPAWAGPGLTAEERTALREEAHGSWVRPDTCGADTEADAELEADDEGTERLSGAENRPGEQPPVDPGTAGGGPGLNGDAGEEEGADEGETPSTTGQQEGIGDEVSEDPPAAQGDDEAGSETPPEGAGPPAGS